VASVFISRWDKAVADEVPDHLRDRLGIAGAKLAYAAYRQLLDSDRWLRLANAGARPQRLLWASTGTKDPEAPDVLYVEALAAPFTINTIPDKTLKAFDEHGAVGELMPADGGDAEEVLAEFSKVGINRSELAERLQRDGTEAFDESWRSLLTSIEGKM
jgi:transaldolase